jgi:hypothetical protein
MLEFHSQRAPAGGDRERNFGLAAAARLFGPNLSWTRAREGKRLIERRNWMGDRRPEIGPDISDPYGGARRPLSGWVYPAPTMTPVDHCRGRIHPTRLQ